MSNSLRVKWDEIGTRCLISVTSLTNERGLEQERLLDMNIDICALRGNIYLGLLS